MDGYDIQTYETMKERAKNLHMPVRVVGDAIYFGTESTAFRTLQNAWYWLMGYERGLGVGKFPPKR